MTPGDPFEISFSRSIDFKLGLGAKVTADLAQIKREKSRNQKSGPHGTKNC